MDEDELLRRRESLTMRENKLVKDEEHIAKEMDKLDFQKLEQRRFSFNQEQALFAKERDQEQKLLAKEKDLEEKNRESGLREQELYKKEKDVELKSSIAAIREARLAEKEEEWEKFDLTNLTKEKQQLKMDTENMQKDKCDLKEERFQQNKESSELSIREKLLATGEEKLKKANLQLENEQVVLRNNKDLSTTRNEMARKEDQSLAKREQVMVRREEVFFLRELEMKKEKENMKKEKSQDMAFSKTLAKEKEEQVTKKLKLRKQEQKMREDLKVREDKLRVDVRKFNKRERQQKLLNKELSILRQPSTSGSSNYSRGWSRASGSSKSSGAPIRCFETSRGPDRRKGSISSRLLSMLQEKVPKELFNVRASHLKSHTSNLFDQKAPNAEVIVQM